MSLFATIELGREMTMPEAKSKYLKMCELHRKFANDSDTEENIQEKMKKSRRVLDNLMARVERRKQYEKESFDVRLTKLMEEAMTTKLTSRAYRIARSELNERVIPFSSLESLDINDNGNMLLTTNEYHGNFTGSLWCFRNVRTTQIPAAGNSFVRRPHPWLTEYRIDAPMEKFGYGNACAVGRCRSNKLTAAVHVKSKPQLTFYVDKCGHVGLSKYNFLDQIVHDSVKNMPKERVEMAKQLEIGLFDRIVVDNHLPLNQPRGKVIALSAFNDSRRILTGCNKGCFVVWNENLCRVGYLVNGISSKLTALHSLPEIYEGFIAADNIGNWNIYDLRANDAIVNRVNIERGFIKTFTIPVTQGISGGHYILGGTSYGKVKLYDRRMLLRRDSKAVATKKISQAGIQHLGYHPERGYLSVATTHGLKVFPWNQSQIDNNLLLSSPVYSYNTDQCILSVSFLDDCCYLIENPGRISRHNFVQYARDNPVES